MAVDEQAKILHPVIEIFGPVIQGEGALVGAPTHFVRFGGCDYSCTWCDSKFAVDPVEVKENSVKMSSADIMWRLSELSGMPAWVTLSGGNPALQHLDDLVESCKLAGYKIAVETQGTIWREWLLGCDLVTVSPKPPSSGNETSLDVINAFRSHFYPFVESTNAPVRDQLVYKIVCFTTDDLDYLIKVVENLKGRYPVYAMPGTAYWEDDAKSLLTRTQSLITLAIDNPKLGAVRIVPQLHYLLYGNARGV